MGNPLLDARVRLAVIFATWFGCGLIRPTCWGYLRAGTYGSIGALPLCWLMIVLDMKLGNGPIALMSIVFVLAAWTIPYTEAALGPRPGWRRGQIKTQDQNEIVIDEVLGMLVTCFPLTLWPPHSRFGWVVAFLLALLYFRIQDIAKLAPTAYVERRFEGPFGVVIDDVVAGVYAACMLAISVWLFRL